MNNEPAIPLAEQIRCVERELVMRRNVYRKRVLDGRMMEDVAGREIAGMQAVLDTLKKQRQPELL